MSFWTHKYLDIVDSLTLRVRCLSVSQIQRIWWPNKHEIQNHLDALVESGFVSRHSIRVHPEFQLIEPLVSWQPGGSSPDYGYISNRCKERWQHPAELVDIIVASPKASSLFGSSADGVPPLEHRDHDMLLAQVYTFYRLKRPTEVIHWVGEHAIPKAGYEKKDPDAFLMDEYGVPFRAVESAGRYDARRIAAFHNACLENNLAYELW